MYFIRKNPILTDNNYYISEKNPAKLVVIQSLDEVYTWSLNKEPIFKIVETNHIDYRSAQN